MIRSLTTLFQDRYITDASFKVSKKKTDYGVEGKSYQGFIKILID